MVDWWNDHDSGKRAWTAVNAVDYQRNGNAVLPILQIVTASTGTLASTTGTSYANTNLTAGLTMSKSTNKVLILASGTLANNTAAKSSYAGLSGTTNGELQGSTKFLAEATNLGNAGAPCTLIWLDAPGTVAAQTYKVRIKNGDGVSTATFGDTDNIQFLILVEIGS